MKKILISTIICFSLMQASACDICGCGVGSNYIGILPDFSKHIIGMRYRYNTIQSHLGVNGSTTYLTTKEVYRLAEFWGGWNIGKNFRVMASIPFSFNERRNQGISNYKNGLGDITMNGYYQVVNKRSALRNNNLLVQSLWLGGGIKIPTGKYEPADKSEGGKNTNLFQLGTASTDFILNAMYDIRLQDIGVNIAAAYKINTTNKYHYRYGNKLSTTAQLYYKIMIKNKVRLAPNAGVQYEHSDNDTDDQLTADISGGYIFSGMAGIEAGYKKTAVGVSFQEPLKQRLAKDIVKSGNKLMLHISFIL